jgi:hypothetical protein
MRKSNPHGEFSTNPTVRVGRLFATLALFRGYQALLPLAFRENQVGVVKTFAYQSPMATHFWCNILVQKQELLIKALHRRKTNSEPR